MSRPLPKACMSIQDLEKGMRIEQEYTISYEDVVKFSEVSGDFNPVHHDPEYASTTIFKKQIAHGLISLAKFSGLFGMQMPGLGAVYYQQSVKFLAPCYLDTPYKAIGVVKSVDREKNVVIVQTLVEDLDGNVAMDGEGHLKPIPEKIKVKVDPALIDSSN